MNAFVPRLLMMLLVAPAVFADSATNLSLRGAIVPTACEPMISGGGTVDYGKMSAKTLDPEQPTSLPRQSLLLSVRCEGLTLFNLTTQDNRSGSSAIHDDWHGLGMTPNDEKLGSVGFGLYHPVADGAEARTIISEDGGATWHPGSVLGHQLLLAVAQGTGLTPIAVKDFDAELVLYTLIAHANSLTLTDEIPMDGHTTVQLNYL
ncbi:Protein of unknown function [Pseudomonas sp. ok272]|uniref:DUF1120 domain-containing protein n=1 Tax=unclassified Pseudomonas TaxID=196821 RepID=UPI0008BEE58C|nr:MULTISPECIES: DUF1120 domain-containing protein [unclassified Pseudomonas]SEM32292.1 Protein of unknown function [Pseudomonas sp. ok272]SFM32229.1 Protein of unknown function [Pseudomonas sp. ok602]